MDVMRVSLFGKIHIQRGDQVYIELDARKAQELFCYLLLFRNRSHNRETLADLLWGESGGRTKKYLRQALWQLQSALEPDGEADCVSLLLVEPEWIQVDPQAELWLDVATFENTFNTVQHVPGLELSDRQAKLLGENVQLYQGDLLEGCYQDWCIFERERLQSMYLTMLDKLLGYCEAHHEYETGLTYGAQILRYERARERTHRQLMRLHYGAGNRTDAIRQFQRCAAILEEELGVPPARRTLDLYERICADGGEAPVSTPMEQELESELDLAHSDLSLPEVLHQLEQLQGTLAKLQRQVGQCVQAFEQALNDRR